MNKKIPLFLSCFLSSFLIATLYLPWADFGSDYLLGYQLPWYPDFWIGLSVKGGIANNLPIRIILGYSIPFIGLLNIGLIISIFRKNRYQKVKIVFIIVASALGILAIYGIKTFGIYHYTTYVSFIDFFVIMAFLLYILLSLSFLYLLKYKKMKGLAVKD